MDGGLEPKAAAHSSLAAQRTAASPRRCPDGDGARGGGWRPRVESGASAQLPSRAAIQRTAARRATVQGGDGDGRRRMDASSLGRRQPTAASPRRCLGGDTDGRRRTDASSRQAAPAHSCMAVPLSRRRQGREARDGRLESRGSAGAQLLRSAAVQRIAALPRRCSGGDRDEGQRAGASSQEAAPAHSRIAAPLSSA